MNKKNLKLTPPESKIYSTLLKNMGFTPTKDQDWLFVVLSKFFLSFVLMHFMLKGYAGTGKTTLALQVLAEAQKGLKPYS